MSKRDKFLTEQIGECWHEPKQRDNHQFEDCIKCGASGLYVRPLNNFSTPDGFFKLLNWIKDQGDEFIGEFIQFKQDTYNAIGWNAIDPRYKSLFIKNIEPDSFANELYEFIKEYNEYDH